MTISALICYSLGSLLFLSGSIILIVKEIWYKE